MKHWKPIQSSIFFLFVVHCRGAAAYAQDKNPNLRVLAEPFVFHGQAYLKLSLENVGEGPAILTTKWNPTWTPNKMFQVLVDGKESKLPSLGSFGGPPLRETIDMPEKCRLFFGVAFLTSNGKLFEERPDGFYDGYSERFSLPAGDHAVEVRSNVVKAASAKLKVTIPANIKWAAPDSIMPMLTTPLTFTVSKYDSDSEVRLKVHVGNESTKKWRYPYLGDTPPRHRTNWYQLEVDGKTVSPVEKIEHPDGKGSHEIAPMKKWYAHSLVIVSDKIKDRKLANRDHHPLYELPEGEHTVRVVPTPLWAEQGLPVPTPGVARIRVLPTRD